MPLSFRSSESCRWDILALGEVMLRLDPGERRVATARSFAVCEGGGEYNVARGLRRCFGLRAGLITAFADNPVGRLLEDLILQGGVDQSLVKWVPYDGVGRAARNGLNFTERGFGVRAPLGCSDRGHTAVSQLRPGDFDWEEIFGRWGARWFHTGGIFCALSDSTPAVAAAAMRAARRHGAIVSYDLNYRESLWRAQGGQKRAQEVNGELVPLVDVLVGNEEDYTAALGFSVPGADEHLTRFDADGFERMLETVAKRFPVRAAAATLRRAVTASRNDWGAVLYMEGKCYRASERPGLEILDRVGGGDSFASGLIYGLLTGREPQWAVECGAAHGALAMTTPGDTSMATLPEVLNLMKGVGARIAR
ncbi:MAG TPA: sugar kinase [Terriglobales bacterium]|nr:sugar kinase [Terriglobales bacterium]